MDFNAKQYPGLHIQFHPSGLLCSRQELNWWWFGSWSEALSLSHEPIPTTGGPGIDSFAGFFPGLYLELNI